MALASNSRPPFSLPRQALLTLCNLDKVINQIGLHWLKLQFCHEVLFGPIILKKKMPMLDSTRQKHNKPECRSFWVKVNGIIDKGHLGLLCQQLVPKG